MPILGIPLAGAVAAQKAAEEVKKRKAAEDAAKAAAKVVVKGVTGGASVGRSTPAKTSGSSSSVSQEDYEAYQAGAVDPTWTEKDTQGNLKPPGLVDEPVIVRGTDINKERQQQSTDVNKQLIQERNKIDPNAQYQTQSGDVVSGQQVISQYNRAIMNNISGGVRSRVNPSSDYIKKGDSYYKVDNQFKYILSNAEQRERLELSESLGSSDMESKYAKAYESLTPDEKIIYLKRYGKIEGKSWTEYTQNNPNAVMNIEAGKIVVYKEPPVAPVSKPKERSVWNPGDWWEDTLGTLGGGISDIFSPERFEYARASLLMSEEEARRPFQESERMKEIREGARDINRQLWEKGDYLGLAGRVVSSPLVLPVISYGAGFAFGAGFSLVGSSAAPGSSAFASYGPLVSSSIVSGTIGADIGLTAAKEEKGYLPEGTTFGKISTYGIGFYSAGLGAVQASAYKPVEAVGYDKYGNLVIQKHITSFRGKPVLPYGEPAILGRTPSGLARVVSPFPSKGGIDFYTPKQFLKNIVGWEKPPSWEPSTGMQPSSIYNIKPIGSQEGTVVQYGNKIFYDFGKFWQPYSKPVYPLSTVVLPKPKLYGSYETYFMMLVIDKGPLVSITPKIEIKPFKPFTKTGKDIFKSDTELDKIFSGGSTEQGGGLKTVQIQKTETATATKQLQKQILKVDSVSKLRVESVSEQKLSTKQVLQSFSSLSQEYASSLKTSQKQASIMLYGFKLDQKLKQDQQVGTISLSAVDTMFKKRLDSISLKMLSLQPVSLVSSISAQAQAQQMRYDYNLIFEIPTIKLFDFTKPYPIKPNIPKTNEPSKPRKLPRLPGLPEMVYSIGGEKETSEGYNVFVKSRQYYKGKPRGAEKYRMLTNKSLSYDDAMSLMGSALDNSIAQQGYIKPSDKPASRLHKSIPDRWSNINFKFDNKDGKFLEQRSHAIDTRGESQDLDVYRWYQQQPIIKKTNRKSSPVTSIDMYSFDKMNNMFNKTNRRMRTWGR